MGELDTASLLFSLPEGIFISSIRTKPRHDPGNKYVQDRLQKLLPGRGKLGKIEQERCFCSAVHLAFVPVERQAHAQATI